MFVSKKYGYGYGDTSVWQSLLIVNRYRKTGVGDRCFEI